MGDKTTNKELVEELLSRNKSGKYDHIIAEAKDNQYHDFKNEKYACGKIQLVSELSEFPELTDIKDAVIRGDYDESMDEADKKDMKDYLEYQLGEKGAKPFISDLGLE